MKVRRIDFSPDEWIAGTIDLTLAERGMYITACSLIYSRGQAILPGMLRSVCHEDLRTYNRCLKRLLDLGKLDLNDGYLSNKRCLSELESANKRSATAAENIANRWKKVNENKLDTPETVLPVGNSNHQPSTINHQPEKKEKAKKESRSAPASLTDLDFEIFWRECPKKVGKGAAHKAWLKARQMGAALEALLAGMKRFAALKAGSEIQFIAHPATWLNQQRWLDEDGTIVEYKPRVPTAPPPMLDEANHDEHSADQSISEPGTLPENKASVSPGRIFSVH